METFLRPPMLVYRNLRRIYIFNRQFKTRSGRQSIGLGSSKNDLDYEGKMNDFYQDNKMQKLWNNTFERIASLQQSPSSSTGSSQHQYYHNVPIYNTSSMGSSSSTSFGNNRGSLGRFSGASSSPTNPGFSTSSNTNQGGSAPKQTTPMFPINDQQLMKLSFAEGYFYGQENSKGKKPKYRFIILLRDAAIAVAIITAFWNFSGTDSPFKKVFLGKNTFEIKPEDIDVSFSDVKGCDESKKDLADIVEFLRNPKKFSRLGGKLPKGVLLVGPPGTGKTLLARAVAGEADVPFFHAAGSEFDEILVGQGARRVRDLFEKAKLRTPCVIFIDEIDSVGGKRSNSVIHPYANQTINQLLSEMDGFNQNEGVIVLGATNRANDLDKALLRPGRFDVQVTVQVPDYKGRKELFEHYLSKVRASSDIDLDVLCRNTVGMTGADIENLVNQAALKAATDDLDSVTYNSLEYAREKILMGPEGRANLRDPETNLMTAYHEGGHAIVAWYTEKANKLQKITIIPRAQSLGYTATLPERDQYNLTREQLTAKLDMLLGGRMAEELIFGSDRVTIGCYDDFRKATAIATQMVKDYGMSEKVGTRVVREEESTNQIVVSNFSDATNELVESEINRLLDESKSRARDILTKHLNELKLLAEALVKYETLDAAEVKLVLEGKDPKILRQERERQDKLSRSKLRELKPSDRLPLDLLK